MSLKESGFFRTVSSFGEALGEVLAVASIYHDPLFECDVSAFARLLSTGLDQADETGISKAVR